MMDFLSRNLDTVLLIALLGFKLLEFIAPKTATTADDKIVSAVNWALNHANGVFNIVEDLTAAGLIKRSKVEVFREELQKQYRKVYGKDLPQQAVSAAENIAAGLAAEDHNVKRQGLTIPVSMTTDAGVKIVPLSNPQPAPAQ